MAQSAAIKKKTVKKAGKAKPKISKAQFDRLEDLRDEISQIKRVIARAKNQKHRQPCLEITLNSLPWESFQRIRKIYLEVMEDELAQRNQEWDQVVEGNVAPEPDLRKRFSNALIDLRAFQKRVYQNAKAKGFWDKPTENGTKFSLMHEEISEATGADREGNPADDKIPQFSGIEAELADCMIRILDFAEGRNMDVIGAMLAKADFNETRQHMHGKAY